ncbi:hypothetical protein CW304_07390 [Bacillus sp. UFRGS-B20]|nr:hypothetical protein CW304_07390 [Bacillus sp. UFRGS-B20]
MFPYRVLLLGSKNKKKNNVLEMQEAMSPSSIMHSSVLLWCNNTYTYRGRMVLSTENFRKNCIKKVKWKK